METHYKGIAIFYLIFWSILAIIIAFVGDINLALLLNGKEENWFSTFIEFYTNSIFLLIAFVAIFALLTMLVPSLKKFKSGAMASWLSYAISLLIIVPTKIIIARERPYIQLGDQINNFGHELHDKSFPSGHSGYSAAVLTAGALTFRQKLTRIIAIAIHIGYMYTRVFLGVHWLSDVLVGSIIGVVIAYLSVYLFAKLEKSGKTDSGYIIWGIFIFCLIVTIYSLTL